MSTIQVLKANWYKKVFIFQLKLYVYSRKSFMNNIPNIVT